MTSSASATSSVSSDPVTAALPTASAHPPRPTFLRPSHAPLFHGRPINPNNPGGTGAVPLYPPMGPSRAFPPRSVGDRTVTVANPAGYVRSSSPSAAISLQAQVQAQAQGRSIVFASAAAAAGSASDPAAQVQQHPGAHPMRPPHLQHHQFVVPRQQLGHGGPHRTAPVAVAAQPKVNLVCNVCY